MNYKKNYKYGGLYSMLAQGGKPDYLDLDKDGDKEELMREASKQMSRGGRVYRFGGKMYDNGGKNKNGGPTAPEGAEKGTVFYDKEYQGFYQVMPAGNVQRVENAATLERAIPRGVLGFATREGSGDAAFDEFLEKYSDIAPTMGSMEGDEQNASGYRSSVRKAINQALSTGDAALMSALLNPTGGEGAIMGIEPASFQGSGFRSIFSPSGEAAKTSLVNVGGDLKRIQAGTATEDGYQVRRPNIRDMMRMLEQQ